MDLINHYIKNESLVEIPTDFKQLLTEAFGLGTLFSKDPVKDENGKNVKDENGDAIKIDRKEAFIKLIDAKIADPGSIEIKDVNEKEIQLQDTSLWPDMKTELEAATGPKDKRLENWKGTPIKGGKNKDGTPQVNAKFARLTGVSFSNFGKANNGFSGVNAFTDAKTGTKKPTGADWEHLITHEYNKINKLPPHKDASDHAKKFGPSYFLIANTIAKHTKLSPLKARMKQFGGGKGAGNLTKFWKQWGAKDGTPKADMTAGNYSISLKKEGGSQLMSAGKGETLATFHAALDWWQGGGKGKKYVKKLIKEVENRFDKVATHHSKTELARIAKLPEDEWPEDDRAAVEQFIDVEAFHKEITKDIKANLDPTQFAEFRNYFVYEAMSGQKKFGDTLPKARASVCVEFDAGTGNVTKWIPTTSDAQITGFTDPPAVSQKVASIAKSVNMYVSWKSSSGDPYSTWRVGMKEHAHDNIPSIKTILKNVILEDKLVRRVNKKLLSENIQLDEFKLLKKVLGMFGKKVPEKLKWVGDLYAKFLELIKAVLEKIKKLAKNMWQKLLEFLGFEVDDVDPNFPNQVKEFMHASSKHAEQETG